MGDDKPKNASASTKRDEGALIDEFVKRTGYGEADVLSANTERRTVVTSNGGKYALTRDGGITVLGGPTTPNKRYSFIPEEPETGNLKDFEG